jgi:hypothetical protein
MNVELFVCTYRGGAAHRWHRLAGKGNGWGGELIALRA